MLVPSWFRIKLKDKLDMLKHKLKDKLDMLIHKLKDKLDMLKQIEG